MDGKLVKISKNKYIIIIIKWINNYPRFASVCLHNLLEALLLIFFFLISTPETTWLRCWLQNVTCCQWVTVFNMLKFIEYRKSKDITPRCDCGSVRVYLRSTARFTCIWTCVLVQCYTRCRHLTAYHLFRITTRCKIHLSKGHIANIHGNLCFQVKFSLEYKFWTWRQNRYNWTPAKSPPSPLHPLKNKFL